MRKANERNLRTQLISPLMCMAMAVGGDEMLDLWARAIRSTTKAQACEGCKRCRATVELE
jgi:hypothetical protein